MKYPIGIIINGRELLSRKVVYHEKRQVAIMMWRCTTCGYEMNKTNVKYIMEHRCQKCKNDPSRVTDEFKMISIRRYSGCKYLNSKDYIEGIKAKYANGVPKGEVEEWINSWK